LRISFRQWQTQADDEAGYHVDLWTYCFIRRYFLVKFAREAYGGPADLEALIEKAYRKVQSRRHTVADTARYASWVSVVCKNTFLNYLRGRRLFCELSEATEPGALATADATDLPAFDLDPSTNRPRWCNTYRAEVGDKTWVDRCRDPSGGDCCPGLLQVGDDAQIPTTRRDVTDVDVSARITRRTERHAFNQDLALAQR